MTIILFGFGFFPFFQKMSSKFALLAIRRPRVVRHASTVANTICRGAQCNVMDPGDALLGLVFYVGLAATVCGLGWVVSRFRHAARVDHSWKEAKYTPQPKKKEDDKPADNDDDDGGHFT